MSLFIMAIDDSLTVRKILETCLRREGYGVKSFADGEEALRWLVSPQGRVPAFIFLDLTLPGMDGLSVLHCLKRRPALAVVPVVVLSGREGVLDRLKARLAGASEYLTKPFKTADILAVVTRYLALPADVVPEVSASPVGRVETVRVPVRPVRLRSLAGDAVTTYQSFV